MSKLILICIADIAIGGFLGIAVVLLAASLNVVSANVDNWVWISGAIIYLVVILAINIGLYSWYVKTYINRYYYAGEENFITIKKGVFAPTEIHVQWQKIQDVYVDQDVLDRILGLYDVHIASATAASGIEAHIDGVDQAAAEGLKHFFLNKVSGGGKNPAQGNGTQPLSQLDQATQPQPKSAAINLSEDISSKTYPLSSKWTTVALIGRFFSSLAFPSILVFYFYIKSKDMSIVDHVADTLLVWGAILIVTYVARVISLFLWKRNYAFNFTPEHIYYKEGILSISEKHMPYSSIQDVTVSQDIFERFFGLAKVVIENASQQQTVTTSGGRLAVAFNGIIIQGLSLADANKITDLLKTSVLGKNGSRFGL